jgi:hypothetical protein
MADQKISALTALSVASIDLAADLVPIVDASAGETKRIAVGELLQAGFSVVNIVNNYEPGGDVAAIAAQIDGAVVRSNQMFDASAITEGYFVNNLSGTLQANADFVTSDFMPVVAGLQYSMTYKSYIVWYDDEQTYISGSDPTETGTTQTAPTGAAFLRVSLRLSFGHDPNLMMVSQSSSVLPIEPYGGILTGSRVQSLPGSALVDASVLPQKLSSLSPTKNLFNWRTATLDKFISAEGSIVDNSSYAISALIPVDASTTYVGKGVTNNTRFWAAFNAAGVLMSGGSNTQADTLTTPAGCAFVRVTLFKTDLYSYQLEEGSSQTSFERYGYRFDPTLLGKQSGWTGLKWAALGDSLTAQNTWTAQITSEFGLALTNLGIGGTLVAGSGENAMHQDVRVNAIPTDAALVTVLGGTNDWAQNTAIGADNSSNTAEFAGALNVLIGKVIARCPTARVVVITPPYSEFPDRVEDEIWDNAIENTLGLSIRDYSAAVRRVAARHSIAVCDWDANCGFTTDNVAQFMKDDGGLLHPNDAVGGPRLAAIAAATIRALEPV